VVRKELEDGVDVDALRIVVELEPVAELAPHRVASVFRRKPPWYS
jgi:hypothetical protein